MEKITRRDFLKKSIFSITAVGTIIALNPFYAFGDTDPENELIWSTVPCRFCGTGCSALVGIKDGKILAVKGNPDSTINQGTLCIKGYSLPFIQYGQDRLTQPLIRMENGEYSKEGELTAVTWDEALDLITQKVKAAISEKGPSSVSMFGSGQWTIWEGYAASKLWKGGLKSNSLEVNARHCMASAVAGFMTTFGMDEPMGSYNDFEHADAFILWGANMVEMHPVLFSKIISRLKTSNNARLINLTTISNRSSNFSEKEMLFVPQTDLAIANGIAYLLINDNKLNMDFIGKHTIFKKGKENIGYGLEDNFKFSEEAKLVDIDEYKSYISKYTPEYVSELSGISIDDLKYLASIYGDPVINVMSFWTMGMNQHTRGTWINNLVYNLHLLTGKICEPGNVPYSLTGQPSACGTCREVGTFTHRLPADMVVTNPEHREKTERLWGIPTGTIPDKPSYHAMSMMQALDNGDVKVFWSMTANPFHSYPNLARYRSGGLKEDRFIIVSDVYPTRSTEMADVVLPSAMWIEKEGAFGNSERRTQFWSKKIDAPGVSKSDLWQLIEFAKRMELGNLFTYSETEFPLSETHQMSDASMEAEFHIEKALWNEYRKFGLEEGHDLAPYDVYMNKPEGLRWPVVNNKETVIRYKEGYDPYVNPGESISFYGNKNHDNKAVIWLRPYEPPPEVPDYEYPFWLSTGRVLEHWHTGTMTRRVERLYKAYPNATAHLHPEDAANLDINNGDMIKIISRRGEINVYVEINGRAKPQKGMIFVPFFDKNVMINMVTLDAYCPISKQPDFKKCAVKIVKL